ncbi:MULTISPECIES: hypothetical protein [unclassified Luteimonas]|uniref:hypothetical protein n=1 Tax=unclassified Luteimonas TaxID=2629088 RepID=UPI0018F064A5|nr:MULTISPECIES: hypothetical protein [unclassified Luteimonas]MBJ6977864.1 hypothetical protein [Luteimonas sp. MC1895]MBJ6984684.1 hypothetical protein [Luteimonas sp. MC1750]QQO04719.1 hypothetical protein JGR68_07360 [Luteimonas sp. MC1750]
MTPQRKLPSQGAANQATTQHQHPEPARFARRMLASGSLASLLSTVAVSVFSRRRSGHAAAGTNAASQWFWYPRARHVDEPSLRYTVAGYGVHHASSLLWGGVYESLQPRRAGPRGRALRAAAVALGAYVVDYHVVSRRLSPGFEHRIGPAGMLAAYGMFGLGLFIAGSVGAHSGSRRACSGRGGGGAMGERDAGTISFEDLQSVELRVGREVALCVPDRAVPPRTRLP